MKNVFYALMIAGLLSGCETMPYQVTTRADRASMTQDQLIAQESQRRLSGRLEALESEIGRIGRDLDTLRSQLDSRCASIEQKSEADKREMVARLSGELDKLMKQAAARPAAAPSARGIEHTIQAGETLYIISKAYGVSSKTIIDANKLSDPDRLSVGQKLFIPQ
ncbi:MAG: LysM domain-containing protein [Kiritimatiellales bacterium]|nr:LysM domain-containing protein [Kiritimatiellales bacterium]